MDGLYRLKVSKFFNIRFRQVTKVPCLPLSITDVRQAGAAPEGLSSQSLLSPPSKFFAIPEQSLAVWALKRRRRKSRAGMVFWPEYYPMPKRASDLSERKFLAGEFSRPARCTHTARDAYEIRKIFAALFFFVLFYKCIISARLGPEYQEVVRRAGDLYPLY